MGSTHSENPWLKKHAWKDSSTVAQNNSSSSDTGRKCVDEAVRWMDPNEIKYSQATIPRFFRKFIDASSGSTYSQALKAASSGTLEDLLQRLRSGVIKIEEIPKIRVVRHVNAWYTLDNRRLWVFRNYGENIPVIVQKPSKELLRKIDVHGDGETVAFETSQPVQEYRQNSSLAALVLSWSLENIQNDELFAKKVEKIPLQFPSMKNYLTYFINPLLEETRAQLKQGLEALADAPRTTLISLQEKTGKEKGPLRKFRLEVEGKTNLKPNDIVLLTTIASTDLADFLQFKEHYTLALLHGEIHEAGKDAVEDTKLLRADVYAPVDGIEYKQLLSPTRTWHVIYLTTLATALRTWEALHQALSLPSGITNPIIDEVLYPEEKQQQFSFEADGNCENSVLALTDYKLNDSQTNAISNTVSGLVNNERPYVRLVQGPPGTGKTTMLVGMIKAFCNIKKRVLMSAPTNTAICEVLNKFLESKSVRSGDILLLGNKERLPVEDLSHVFLPDRVKRLLDILHPIFGYRHKIMSMLDFLENAQEMHKQFLACSSNNHVSFLQFVRKKLKFLGQVLVVDVEIACSDLPSKFLKSTGILSAKDILSNIHQMMKQNVSDSVARSWFQQLANYDTGFVFNKPVSLELHRLLRLLRENLKFVCFPTPKVLTHSWLEKELVKQASVVFCTVSSSGRWIVQDSLPFSVGIVDEASQLVEAQTTIVMGLKQLRQLVLVGDHHQLPATVISNVARACGYGRSLFQRLQALGHPTNMLNIQYRMHPAICMFPNNQFYNGKLQNGPNVEKNDVFQSLMYGPYKFIDTVVGVEMDNEGHSKQNPIEVEILVYILRKLDEEWAAESKDLQVGIISPYSGQVKAVERRLRAFHFKLLKLEVNSVDGFQGREKDVILVSTVRSNGSGNIGFLEDYRRLNVAITRARSCLYIVGHANTLGAKECVWKELIENAIRRECFMDLAQNEEVCKLIKRVKGSQNPPVGRLHHLPIPFKRTIWKVLFSQEFTTSLIGIKSLHIKQNILHAIFQLSNGQWPEHKFPESEMFPDVINVKSCLGLYIVWTVDVQRDPVIQIIKVWNVVIEQKLLGTVNKLEKLLSTYTELCLERCKPENRSDMKLAIPLEWRKDDTFVRYKPAKGEQRTGAKDLWLMKFCWLSSGVAQKLLAATNEANIEHLFPATEEACEGRSRSAERLEEDATVTTNDGSNIKLLSQATGEEACVIRPKLVSGKPQKICNIL